MKLKYILFISIYYFFITSALYGSTLSSKEKELKKGIENIVTSKMKEHNILGLSVCIDSPKFRRTVIINRGYKSKLKVDKITDETTFRIGSITKSFTALSVLKMHEDGLLNLNDKISKYLKFDSKKLNSLTILELMNMASGLKCYINDIEDDDDKAIINNFIYNDSKSHLDPKVLIKEALRLGYTKEKKFSYANTNYIILGMLIEKISKKTYAEYIKEIIIDRLHLKHTYVPINNELLSSTSRGYQDVNDYGIADDWSDMDQSYVWSAGNIISNTQDINIWMRAIINNSIINKEDYIKYSLHGKKITKAVYYTSGLVYDKNSIRLGHNGAVIGYHGDMWYDFKTDSVVTSLSNGISSKGDLTKEITDEIFKLLKGS
nr:serine hydrolase domain-containing protein [uncultured Sulfurimonas sp.]